MLFSKPSHSSWCRIESFSPRPSEASAVAPWNKLFPWLPWNHTLLLSSASPVTPYLPGFFSLHKEEAHHFSLSHLLIILYFSTALLGSAHLQSWLQNVAFQFCISPDLSPRLTQNPIRCCPLDDPQVLPTKRVSSWISHLLRQPHLLLLTFTNRSLPLPLLITTGNGLPRSHPCHSSFFFSVYHQVLLILPSSYFSIMPYMHPHCDHQGAGHTHGFVLFIFLFLSFIPNYNFPMFQPSNSSPIASEECPNS